MRRLFVLTTLLALSATATMALFSGCSSNSTIAQQPTSPSTAGRVAGLLNINTRMGRHNAGYYTCRATGPIEYMSDFDASFVYVYAGKFTHQAPCGEIPQNELFYPTGVYVQTTTHDLYVANSGANNVLVFHRGQTTPYNTYTDPTFQIPNDITVAEDGTVIAINAFTASISTWIAGPNGGTFVGNFPNTNSNAEGLFVTVDKNGEIYFDDDQGALWSLKCPAGACGAIAQVAGVHFSYPGGLAIGDTGNLLAVDTNRRKAETFDLPNPNPKKFHLDGIPTAMAMSRRNNYLFVTDRRNNDAAEYSYPGGILIGTVPGTNGGGTPAGIAVDP